MLKLYYENLLVCATEEYVRNDGKYYIPRSKINFSLLKKSEYHRKQPHLGEANFYDLKTDRVYEEHVAWYYPHTDKTTKKLENLITFNRKIDIIES